MIILKNYIGEFYIGPKHFLSFTAEFPPETSGTCEVVDPNTGQYKVVMEVVNPNTVPDFPTYSVGPWRGNFPEFVIYEAGDDHRAGTQAPQGKAKP